MRLRLEESFWSDDAARRRDACLLQASPVPGGSPLSKHQASRIFTEELAVNESRTVEDSRPVSTDLH